MLPWFRCIAVLLALSGACFGAALADGVEKDPQSSYRFEVLTSSIFPSSEHHLTDELSFQGLYDWKQELSGNYGIDFALLSAPVFQVGTNGGDPYFDNEVDLLFSWRFLENDRTKAKVFFYGLWVQTLGDEPTGEFARNQGVITAPNSGGTDPGNTFVSLAALWWEQSLSDPGIRFRVGQLWSTNLWATNEFYGDDRATYMSTLMGGGAGVPWIGGNRGLGAMAAIERDWGYVAAGFQDSKADQQSIDFNSVGDGKFSYLAEGAVNTKLGGEHEGTYKLTVGWVDENGDTGASALPSGWGLNLSGQQRVSKDYAVYGFYRRSFDRFAANVRQAGSVGLTAIEPFGWADDNASIGLFVNEPADTNNGALRTEIGLEAFYRYQATPRLDITPSAVFYPHPGQRAQESPVGVFGLRLRYVL